MAKKKLKIGVIGAGAIAQACHIPGYMAAENCILQAVADPEEKCLKMLEENGMNFKHVYRDYKEMLANEKLDMVSICVPNKFHAECALAALESGADILLEKPPTLKLADSKKIKAAAERLGKRVMVGFSHRFNDMNQAAKKALAEGVIGDPYMIHVRFAHTGPFPGWAKTDWFYNPEIAGGGALLDMAVHAFDIVQFLIGKITAVTAKVATLRKKIKVDDNVVTILEFGKKCMGYVECGWTSPAGFWGIDIMGDNGRLVCDYAQGKVIVTRGVVSPDGTSNQETVEYFVSQTAQWANEMAYATKTAAGKENFSPDINDGINTLKVVLAAYKSSDTGSRVVIK